MKVSIEDNTCTVTREPEDPVFRNGGYAGSSTGESRLLYHVKKVLNARGYDLVKKRMVKDGHLVDDLQQYLVVRSKRSESPHIYIWNGSWSIGGAEVGFNETGSVELAVHVDVYDVQSDCEERVRRLENANDSRN